MFRVATVLLFAGFAAAVPARAGTLLVTPPLLADNAVVSCVVTFLGDESTSATATVHNSSGSVAAGGSPAAIDPGISTPAVLINADGWYYCTFEGLTKGMRGYIVLNVGGQSELVLPAAR